ncbi:hypothetical protein AX761_21930 [Rhizobium sp. 58]|nr:hypothetical protein AX761_21930 [Rhizobium sp. 58]
MKRLAVDATARKRSRKTSFVGDRRTALNADRRSSLAKRDDGISNACIALLVCPRGGEVEGSV